MQFRHKKINNETKHMTRKKKFTKQDVIGAKESKKL